MRDDPVPTPSDGDDWRDVALSVSADEVYPEQFLLNQKAYLDRLCALHHHGNSLANLLVLIRTWSQGASIHILRHVVVTREWAALVDAQLTGALEYLLDVALDHGRRAQVFLKIKDGGLGFGSAGLRREAAYIGASVSYTHLTLPTKA